MLATLVEFAFGDGNGRLVDESQRLVKVEDDSYLLDIRKVDGDVLPFMDVCSLLLGELKL